MKSRRFELYIFKNKIPGVLVSIVLLVVMLIMADHFKLMDSIRSRSYRTISDIESRQNQDDRDVIITIDRADYAGYEYYEDSERQGRYYFCQQDGRFCILLLKSTEDVVLNYSVRGRVVAGQDAYETIVTSAAKDMGIPRQQLESNMYKLIISEVDFPRIYYNMMLLILILSALWAVYSVVSAVICIAFPWKMAHIRSGLGDDAGRSTIHNIDEQLKNNLLFDRDGIVITDGYFIYHGMWHTDIVKLKNIEHFRKLLTASNIGIGSKRIYKLLMRDVDGVTYEQNFKSEAALDEAMSYLDR